MSQFPCFSRTIVLAKPDLVFAKIGRGFFPRFPLPPSSTLCPLAALVCPCSIDHFAIHPPHLACLVPKESNLPAKCASLVILFIALGARREGCLALPAQKGAPQINVGKIRIVRPRNRFTTVVLRGGLAEVPQEFSCRCWLKYCPQHLRY